MTRGKHGISAAARQAVGERDKQIEAYQHNIRKLTAENAELKQKLVDMQAAHSQTVRELKAQRDEGLSPMLSALQSENERLKDRERLLEGLAQEFRDRQMEQVRRVIGHFESSHGLTSLEAIEEATKFFGISEDFTYLPGDYKQAAKAGVHAVRAIQRAMGDRR